MKRIVLLLITCAFGLHCGSTAAQSGTTGDVPAASSPIIQGSPVQSGIVEGQVVEGQVVVEGSVEGAMEPIPAGSYAGEVVGSGSTCCNGGTTAAPLYQSYSTGYPSYGYGYGSGYYPTYRTGWSYGYRPMFSRGLFSRRSYYYCCP